MSKLDWKPKDPTMYMLDECTTIGGIVGVVQNPKNSDEWRGVVCVEGENYYTDWMYLNEAMQQVQLLMKKHGITIKEDGTENPEPEPLTIDEYMYQRELQHPTRAEDYRDFEFVPFGATRTEGVEVNAERNGGQPCVALRIISNVGLLLYGKQRLPESAFMTPRQARRLAATLSDYANAAQDDFEAEYKEAKRAAQQKVDQLRKQDADADPA
jgi:hypothetical protein